MSDLARRGLDRLANAQANYDDRTLSESARSEEFPPPSFAGSHNANSGKLDVSTLGTGHRELTSFTNGGAALGERVNAGDGMTKSMPRKTTEASTKTTATDGKVKVLYSVFADDQTSFYIGGDRLKPKLLLSLPGSVQVITAVVHNLGLRDRYIVAIHHRNATDEFSSFTVLRGAQKWTLTPNSDQSAAAFLTYFGHDFLSQTPDPANSIAPGRGSPDDEVIVETPGGTEPEIDNTTVSTLKPSTLIGAPYFSSSAVPPLLDRTGSRIHTRHFTRSDLDGDDFLDDRTHITISDDTLTKVKAFHAYGGKVYITDGSQAGRTETYDATETLIQSAEPERTGGGEGVFTSIQEIAIAPNTLKVCNYTDTYTLKPSENSAEPTSDTFQRDTDFSIPLLMGESHRTAVYIHHTQQTGTIPTPLARTYKLWSGGSEIPLGGTLPEFRLVDNLSNAQLSQVLWDKSILTQHTRLSIEVYALSAATSKTVRKELTFKLPIPSPDFPDETAYPIVHGDTTIWNASYHA